MAATHSDWLIEQMELELRGDLEAVLRRIDRAATDPKVRARLAVSACSFLFGAACAATLQSHESLRLSPGAIAEIVAGSLVDTLRSGPDHPGPGFGGMTAG